MESKIDLLKYYNQINSFGPLLRYLTIIINETNVSLKLKEFEFDWFFETTKQYLKDQSEQSISEYKKDMDQKYALVIDKSLKDGLITIKKSFLVDVYSIFESFLNHLVTVYCEYFPELYVNSPIKVANNEIIGKNEIEINNIFIEKYVKDFSFLAFDKKIRFIKEKLKLGDSYIWILNNENCIVEINYLRNKIVHSDEDIKIEYERLVFYFNYLNSLVFKLSAVSQSNHGIEFIFMKDSNLVVKQAEKPIL